LSKARGDVIGKSRDLGIGIGAAERRHRDGMFRRQLLGAGKHQLDTFVPLGSLTAHVPVSVAKDEIGL
jgi:hypothetical protein